MSAHDPIAAHPEYARSYRQFLLHTGDPDESARLAYEHVRGKLATGSLAPMSPRRSPAAVLVGAGVLALLGVCGGVGVAGALSGAGNNTATTAVSQAAAASSAVASATPTASASASAAAPRRAARRAPKRATAAAPGIGAAVRDGRFEFAVRSVTCGRRQVGSGYLVKRAQGRYCLLTLSVKNIGDRAQTFDSSSQRAFNARHQEYSADGAAELYANEGTETFLNEINPGNRVTGTLVFDVPPTVSLATVELHDSLFSGGVTVRLR